MDPVLGALFAAILVLATMSPLVLVLHRATDNVKAAATAGQMRQVSKAAEAYIQGNYAAVEANSSPSSPALITIPMLESTGYLSASITQYNPFGQKWVVEVLQPSPGKLQALVTSTGGAAIPEKLAPSIAAETGQEGGFIPYNNQYGTLSSNVAEGAYGHWQVPLAGYINPGPGRLASLLAFNDGSLENDYLYRVAVPGQPELNTMQTSLNMGNNDVANADNIQANGQIGTGTAGNELADMTGNAGTEGQVQTRSPDGAVSTSSLSDNNQAYIGASNSAGGYATMTVPNDGSNSNASISTNGAMYVNKPGGGQSFYAYNNGYGGITDTFQVGSRLELGTAQGQANAGGSCSPNGELAANANGSGQLMACVNGHWQATGSGPEIITRTTGSISTPPPPSCPAGTTLVDSVPVSSYTYWNTLALCQEP